MSVSENFRIFCNTLIQKDVSARYKLITQRLNNDFRNLNSDTAYSLYIGSHGRRTATSKTSDVDMLYQLPYEVYEQYNNHSGNGQSALLQAVRTLIQRTYSTTSIGADGQVVVIPFNDKIKFEVLPAFINKDGSFTYPDTNDGGKWRSADPKPEIEAMKARDTLYNDNLRRLCRMMRVWKDEHNVPIKGLLIDTLAYQFMPSWEYNDKSYVYYDYMVRDFFLYMSNRDSTKTYWLAPGSAERVHRTGAFEYRAKQAYKIALEAIDHEQNKRPYSERTKWREIFGTTYP